MSLLVLELVLSHFVCELEKINEVFGGVVIGFLGFFEFLFDNVVEKTSELESVSVAEVEINVVDVLFDFSAIEDFCGFILWNVQLSGGLFETLRLKISVGKLEALW